MSWILGALDGPLFRAIGWALIDFLWQGLLLAVLLRAALGVLRRARATTRYAVASAGLLLMAALPVAGTLTRLREPGPGVALSQDAPDVGRASAPVLSQPTGARSASLSRDGTEAGGGVSGWAERTRARLERWLPLVVLLWLAGVLVGSARLVGGWVYLRRLRTRWTCDVGEAWTALFERLKQEMGVTAAVRLVGSMRIDVPAVAGALKPVILVPASLLSGMPPADVELILTHELAHVRRHDYLVNLLQSAVETLLFFHPGVWWLSGVVREEREHCCDDAVVAARGRGRRYARALLAAEEMRAAGPGPMLAPALGGGGSLSRRIARLVAPAEVAPSPGGGPLGLALAVLLAAGIGFGQRPLAAATAGPAAAPAALPAPGALGERWREARAKAAAAGWGGYWIAFSARGTASTLTSGSRGDGRARPGASVADLLAAGAAPGLVSLGEAPHGDEVMVLLRMPSPADSVPEAARVWIADRRVALDSLPLAWLGSAPQDESLGVIGAVYAASGPEVRAELVAAASLHDTGPQALALVQRVLETEPSEDVRAEAAFWLQHQKSPQALALLERTATADASPRVREEAVTGIARTGTPAAREALARLERDAPQLAVRPEAGDWLARAERAAGGGR